MEILFYPAIIIAVYTWKKEGTHYKKGRENEVKTDEEM